MNAFSKKYMISFFYSYAILVVASLCLNVYDLTSPRRILTVIIASFIICLVPPLVPVMIFKKNHHLMIVSSQIMCLVFVGILSLIFHY